MIVLITGATGRIGQDVTRHLLAAGARVRVLTRRPHRARELFADRTEIFEWHSKSEPVRRPTRSNSPRMKAGAALATALLRRAFRKIVSLGGLRKRRPRPENRMSQRPRRSSPSASAECILKRPSRCLCSTVTRPFSP